LGSVSFYSSSNSKFFKQIPIVNNSECFSLNLKTSALNDSGIEDELAVTFVCDTQMYVRGICMRPHFIIDLKEFVGEASSEYFGEK